MLLVDALSAFSSLWNLKTLIFIILVTSNLKGKKILWWWRLLLSLFINFVSWTQVRIICAGNFIWQNDPIRSACRQVCVAVSWLVIYVGEFSRLWAVTHGLVALGCLDKQAGHTALLYSFLLPQAWFRCPQMNACSVWLVVWSWSSEPGRTGRESAAGKPGRQSWQCRLSPGADQDCFVCDSQPEICTGSRQPPTLTKAFNRVIMCLCSFPLKRAMYPFLPSVTLSYLWN